MKKPQEFEHLVDALRSLPGVGTKNAKKWAYYLINQDDKYLSDFISRIQNAKNKIHLCESCGNISTEKRCSICLNPLRDKNQICVVSTVEELDRIEESGNYNGLYHVTHGELSIKKNVLVRHTNIDSLLTRVQNDKRINEIIIATNFTQDGEMTAAYILNLLENVKIKIYRIGFGLPLNSAVDYADNETLKHALSNKRILKRE